METLSPLTGKWTPSPGVMISLVTPILEDVLEKVLRERRDGETVRGKAERRTARGRRVEAKDIGNLWGRVMNGDGDGEGD